jgi:transcriptional regulator with XRE-family HTH domain
MKVPTTGSPEPGQTEEVTVMDNDSRQVHEIASRVRRMRRAQDWTQVELAQHAGVAPGTVNSIENGRPVRPGNLRAVLDALHIPMPSAPEGNGTRLAMDMVQQWLTAMPETDRPEAIQALTRFTVLGEWRGYAGTADA